MSESRIFPGNGYPEMTDNVDELLHFPPPRTPFSEWNQNRRVGSVQDQDLRHEKVLNLRNHLTECLPPADRGTGSNFSPRARGKPHSEPNSSQNTPNRNAGRLSFGTCAGGSRNNPHSGSKAGNLVKIPRGISNFAAPSPGTDVPHFALEEDGSFWMDHNVQVLIRIRPICKTEQEMHGYNRCVRQESGQTLAWLGGPETRFTFDHIAGETVTQDLLFQVAGLPMVDNCMSGYNSCIFAYGQTGSGKTYTMMGELCDGANELSEDRGLTPRIFEYLFARIKLEESSRKDERLKYGCKCSFLEIYNEQITDLLDPSSINLQLREDLKKGVYVENLREIEVETVKDVMELLLQGTANRKVAATSMNSESSRSHSVFTCVIESQWEKDAMTHFRFARLNLVDLAGSERQKSSGAEGERLKEAANINKSLSTLGLVIMTLVDVAHGKHRHIPYRDSRLTFLLQDSLGGNSKTTIIANVSPSICCANETLSTLKFSQRAKLIQNNAKVNEDASGDVMALQRQIQQLKDQLTFLEHQQVARPIPLPSSSSCYESMDSLQEKHDNGLNTGNVSISMHDVVESKGFPNSLGSLNILNEKLKHLESLLVSSLRRERMAEADVMQLKAEIEQMNHMCNAKEDDNQHINAILKLRNEKIARLESFARGLQPVDAFLLEENFGLKGEIKLLQARIDRNPELARSVLCLSCATECKDVLCEPANQICGDLEGNSGERLQKIHKSCNRIVGHESSHTLQCDENTGKMSGDFQEVQKLSQCESVKALQPTVLHVMEPFFKKLEEPNPPLPNLRRTITVPQPEIVSEDDTESIGTKNMMPLRAENEELHKRLNLIMEDNIRFSKALEDKAKDSTVLVEWEQETNTLTNFLMDGYHAVEDASHQVRSICDLFPEKNQIDEHTNVTAAALHEKERLTLDLQRRLDSVRDVGYRTNMELSTLKEAITTIIDAQLIENFDKSEEAAELRRLLHEKIYSMHKLEEKVKHQEDALIKMNRRASASFLALSWLLNSKNSEYKNEGSITSKIIDEMGYPSENISKWIHSNELSEAATYIHTMNLHIADLEKEVHELRLALQSEKNLTTGKEQKDETVAELEGNKFQAEVGCLLASCYEDIGNAASFLASDVADVISNTRQWVQDLIGNVSDIKGVFTELKKCNAKMPDLSPELYYHENPTPTENNRGQTSHDSFEEQFDATSKQMKPINEAPFHDNTELLNVQHSAAWIVAKRINEPQALLLKFSEAQETMREADMMLNALLQAYTTAKHEASKWKQKGEALTEEKSMLLLQVQELKNSVLVKEQECEQLQEHFNMLITDVVGTLSSFQDYMIQIKGASDEFDITHSGFIAFVREMLLSVNVLKLFPENLIAAIEEKHFTRFVLSCCLSDSPIQNTLPSTDCHQYCHNSLLDLDRVEETVRLSEEGANDGRNVARGNKLDSFYDNDEEVQISLRSKEHKVMNSMHCVNKNLSIYPQKYASRIKELAIEKEDLVRDIQLMEEIVNHQHVFLEEIGHGLTSLENILAFEKLVDGCITKRKLKPKNAASVDLSCFNTINKMNSFPRMELDHESSLTSWNKSADNQSDYIVQDETSILVDFLNIKNQFIQLLDTLDKSTEASHMIFSRKGSSYRDQRLDSHTQNISRLCSYANCISSSELCRPLVQALIKLDAKLHPLADRISFVHLGLDGTHSMLEKLFENMCKFERKVYMYEENLSELDKHKNNLISQNIQLSSELGRRDAVMQGLLFDLRLLQESTANVKDRKEETEKLSGTLRQTRNSLAVRASDIDCILSRQQRIEQHLTDKEVALERLQSDFRKAQEVVELLTNENAELRTFLDDLYLKKHDFEEQLVEQNEVIGCLKKELLSLSATVEQKIINSARDSEDQLKKVISERDLLLKEVAAIRCELEASLALADENETMAIEARQVSESCKIHAEQKEEEARVLEQSVEELDHTIEIFENKVFEMSNEVERQKLMREELELEMQDLKLRLIDPQIVAGDLDKESLFYLEEGRDSIILRHLEERRNELLEAKQYIHKLEKEKADQAEKYKGYIAELLFHSEAQASHYQEKYKVLEDMAESQHCIHLEDSTANRREHVSGRRRGSGSPFKCITGLINHTNFEKDHELFVARTRMKELEGLAANRQKEVCVLNARLAIAESMTHDVIRDLLGVKLDLSTYVDQFDEQLVQRLVESVRKQSEESRNKEQEFLKLEAQLGDLIKDRERLLEENNHKKSEVLDFQLRVEQLRQSQQLLAAQNELLQMDKQKLKKKIEEMNEMLKTCGLQEFSQQFHHQPKNKENRPLRIRDNDLEYQSRRDSEKRSSHMKDEPPPNRFGRSSLLPHSTICRGDNEKTARE